MVRTYQDVFDELYILDVQGAGNKILVALPSKRRITRADLARKAGAISKKERFPFDMGEIVTYGYQYADKQDPRGRVLRDKK